MRKVLVASLGLVMLLAVAGCKKNHSKSPSTMPAASSSMMMYTCPMHPEVVQDTPGKCPKCGTTLVVKK